MENFLRTYSTIPKKFIDDFFIITKESYGDTEIIIDFDTVCEWLDTRKDNLKEILIKKFEENYDYSITKLTKKSDKTSANRYHDIKISPQCFKELCMISQTSKAKEVRKYFLEMEKLIKKYHQDIHDIMLKKIGLLEGNQKPKCDIKGGVIYVIEALNTDITLYKLGKTIDTKNRFNTYNSGNANDVHPLFIIKVNDVAEVEHCAKRALKNHQYRKYKEVYEVDLETIKDIISSCDEFMNGLQQIFEKDRKKVSKNISRMKKTKNKLFMIMFNDD